MVGIVLISSHEDAVVQWSHHSDNALRNLGDLEGTRTNLEVVLIRQTHCYRNTCNTERHQAH